MQIDRDGNRVLLQMLAEIEVFSTIDDILFETTWPTRSNCGNWSNPWPGSDGSPSREDEPESQENRAGPSDLSSGLATFSTT